MKQLVANCCFFFHTEVIFKNLAYSVWQLYVALQKYHCLKKRKKKPINQSIKHNLHPNCLWKLTLTEFKNMI